MRQPEACCCPNALSEAMSGSQPRSRSRSRSAENAAAAEERGSLLGFMCFVMFIPQSMAICIYQLTLAGLVACSSVAVYLPAKQRFPEISATSISSSSIDICPLSSHLGDYNLTPG